MSNYSAKTVEEYIAAAPPEAQDHLVEICAAMREAIPQAEEKIGYGKPYFKYHGWVAGCDVYAKHIGFEVWDGLSAAEREELESKGYKTGSVTFQIRHDQPVPTAIIQKLVKAQAKLNEQKAKNKK